MQSRGWLNNARDQGRENEKLAQQAELEKRLEAIGKFDESEFTRHPLGYKP